MKKIILIGLISLSSLMFFDNGRAILAGMVAEFSGEPSMVGAKRIKHYLDEKMR